MNLLVVFNPKAAHGRAGKLLAPIRERFERCGIEATFMRTRHAGHASEMLRSAELADYHGVAVVGGDGTLFETVNGMMDQAADLRRPVGLIPLGTGNAFSRDLGLAPGQWREGIDLIMRGATRPVDVAHADCGVEQFYFVNIAGIGFVTDAGRASARLKFAGRHAYTLGTLWCCLGLKLYDLDFEADGKKVRQKSLLLEVSNSRFTGASFKIAPAAKIDDGLLDIVVVRALPRRRLLKLFPSIYSGKHVGYDEVQVIQAREITIRGPEGLELMVDGEIRGRTPATIRCLPGALTMFSG